MTATWRIPRVAVVLAVVGLVVAVGGFVALDRVRDNHLYGQVHAEAATVLATLSQQVERDVAGMVTVGANAVDPRGRGQGSWARPLELIAAEGGLRAVSGVNLAQPLVSDAQLGRLPSSVRERLDLRIGDDDENLVITHVWPGESNSPALGYDILLNERAAQASRRAFDEARVVVSAPVRLIQEPQDTAVIAYVPLRGPRGDVVALATVNFRTQVLVDQLVTVPQGMDARWIDLDSSELLGETPRTVDGNTVTVRHTDESVGRRWAVEVSATPAALAATDRFAPWIVVGLGAALTSFALVSVLQARRDRERALRLVAERTADLERTARSLERVNRDLEDADHAKDELLAAVSHDLRTPITVISGFAATLGSANKPSSRDIQRGLQSIQRQSSRLEALVDDLLTVARLDAGGAPVDRQRLDLAAVTRLVVDDIGLGTVTGGRDVTVLADPFHIERIIANLLINAAKHGEPPFELEVTAARDGEATLRVRDHGDGIPRELRDEVFHPFTQLGAPRAGVGLGLSIAARLATANGGVLRYEDTEHGGASFVLTLPTIDLSESLQARDPSRIGT